MQKFSEFLIEHKASVETKKRVEDALRFNELYESKLKELGVSSPVELNEKQSETLKVFPNPAKNKVYIELTNNSATTNYMLYAVTGEIIFTGRTFDNEIILDLSNLPNGLYLLRTSEQNTQPIKIIKE
jgi:hypothetical protein